MKIVYLFLITVFTVVFAKEENSLAHGFGDDIEWGSWENALELANEQNKPVFLLIHKTWCGACSKLIVLSLHLQLCFQSP